MARAEAGGELRDQRFGERAVRGVKRIRNQLVETEIGHEGKAVVW